jgi:tetratricopeptide (TPR) repeat protein
VLPLENLSNDPEQEYFVEGMTDEIITDLATALSCGFSLVPVSEAMPKAKAAAERALQLDPNLAEAHASLGLIAPFLNWNWAEAKEQYERAIELNPNYATAHHWYAEGYLIPRRRVDDALLQIRRAQELDPLSAVIATDMGKELYFARRYDEAIVELRRALDFDPNFVSVQSFPLAREGVRRKLVLHDFSEILVSLRRSPFQPALRGTTAPCRPSTMSPSSRQRGSSAGMECRA